MTSVVTTEGTRTIVTLHGEADLSTRPALSDVLSRAIASGAGDVVVDLSDLAFIDSATVRALAQCQELLNHRERELTVRSPSRMAARLIGFFGLDELIEART